MSNRKLKNKKGLVCGLLLAGTVVLGCTAMIGTTGYASEETGDELLQYSTIQALTAGDYDGSLLVTELLSMGDIGLGTFDALNGEMTVLDGVCYQTLGDGSVVVAAEEETTPFACVTEFQADDSFQIGQVANLDDMKAQLSSYVGEQNGNVFYAARIEGTFTALQTRSELSQTPPYRTLDEVMKTDQRIFDYQDVTGTIVALYCPEYVSGVNASGWHMHFISEDHSMGGHILDAVCDTAEVQMDQMTQFQMILPDTESFAALDIGGVSQDAVAQVEKGE